MTASAGAQRGLTILQVVPALDAGGAEQTCVEIARTLVPAGHRILAAGAAGRLVGAFEAAGGLFRDLPLEAKDPVSIWRNAGRLRRLMIEESVDIVHARSRAPAWSALIAARRAGRPFVTTYHGIYSERGRAKRLYNSVMARGDVVIANSAFTAALIEARYGTPRERIRIIHRGVEPGSFDRAAVGRERILALRQGWNIGEGDRVALLAGRLTGWKGQEVAIRAMGELAKRGGDTPVLVLAGADQGRDSYRAGLESLVAEFGLRERVRIVGHVDDMQAAFCAADVAVSASTRPEAFGRVIVEAQAMGVAVVASDIGATRETVLAPPAVAEPERTGWLVEPGNPGDLADAIAAALSLTPAERSLLGERQRAHILAGFTVARMAHSTLAAYSELAARPRPNATGSAADPGFP